VPGTAGFLHEIHAVPDIVRPFCPVSAAYSVSPTAVTITAARWSVRAIGPRVGLLLLSQLVTLTLAGGLAQRVLEAIVASLRASPDARAIAFGLIALATLSGSVPLRRALCPASLAALRRQPLGDPSFAWLRLPWTLMLVWPSAMVLWLGHPDRPLVVAAGWFAVAAGTLGVASSARWRTAAAWAALPFVAACLVDRHGAFAWPAIAVFATIVTWPLARAVRTVLEGPSPFFGGDTGRARTPLGVLLGLDRAALGTSLHWLRPLWPPLAGLLYVVVVVGNGNCRGDCPATAGVIVTTLGLGLVVATLGALHQVHGTRLLVPDRIVSTRLRLASLFVASVTPLVPIALALALITRSPLPLTQALTVTLAVLWVQLGDPARAPALGPALYLLVVPVAIPWLPPATRLAASVVVLLVLTLLVERRAATARRALATGAFRGRCR